MIANDFAHLSTQLSTAKRLAVARSHATNIYIYIYKYINSLLKYSKGGDKTSQYSHLVVLLQNWGPDNWVYRLPIMTHETALETAGILFREHCFRRENQ